MLEENAEENIVETNFNQFVNVIGKLKNDNIDMLIESESARLATSPSNAQKDAFGCYNGGMIQDTEWHIEKLGHIYKKNKFLKNSNTERTFQFLFKYGVTLTMEEFDAILSVDKESPLNYLGQLLCASRILICK